MTERESLTERVARLSKEDFERKCVKHNVIYECEDFILKRFLLSQDEQPLKRFGRFGLGCWEYLVGRFLEDQGVPVPTHYGLTINPKISGKGPLKEKDLAEDQTTTGLVMEKIPHLSYEEINDLPRREKDKIREEHAWLRQQVRRLDFNDFDNEFENFNYLYNPEEEKVYLIDFGKWSGGPSLEYLLDRHPIPIVTGAKERFAYNGELIPR